MQFACQSLKPRNPLTKPMAGYGCGGNGGGVGVGGNGGLPPGNDGCGGNGAPRPGSGGCGGIGTLP